MHAKPTAPVQLDANMGWVNAVQKCFFMFHRILLSFACIAWKCGEGKAAGPAFLRGKRIFEWDRDAASFRAEIRAERETHLRVKLPGIFRDMY
jgi:alpha-L-fucosidase 2